LLLGFHLGDHSAHLPVGTLLVEEAIADPTTALPPAAVKIRLEPRPAEPALALLPRRIAPLCLVERHTLMSPHDQSASLSQIHFHLEPPVLE